MQYFTSFDGLKLAYNVEGHGMPVLCLSGLTRNSRDFDYLVPHLPPVRLIRPDYRGRGASEWSTDPNSYSIANEARDALDLLDHLDIPNAAILGTSRGGLIAMVLATTARDRVRGVCLTDIGPVIDTLGLDRIKTYIGKPSPFATQDEMATTMMERLPGFSDVPYSRWLEEADRQSTTTDNGLALNYDPNLRQAFAAQESEETPDLWPLFDWMQGLPLALIRGENSDLLSPETAQEMCKRRPDMTFAEIPNRGHVPFLDEPPAVQTITTWLGECE